MFIGKEVIKHQDKMYLVNLKIAESKQVDLDFFKWKTKSDRVFKAQGFHYFVEDVIDVEPLPDLQYHLEFDK